MRRVGADQPRLTGRWIGKEIAADITRSKTERPQTANLQVREVLADTMSIGEDSYHGRGDRGRSRIEGKPVMDSMHQFDCRAEHRPTGCKRLAGELGQLRRRGDVRRRIAEFCRGVVRRATLI